MMEMVLLRNGDGDDGFVDYVNGFVVSGDCDGFVDYVNAMEVCRFVHRLFSFAEGRFNLSPF